MGMMSKRKGTSFEREVAKMLNATYEIDDKKHEWKRVPLSGGFDTANFPGDLYTMHPKWSLPYMFGGNFSIECKFYKDFRLEDLVNGTKSKIQEWWNQACKDCIAAGKAPIVIFRKNNNKPLFMAYEADLSTYLEDYISSLQHTFRLHTTSDDVIVIGSFTELLPVLVERDRGKV